jgi:hypothetical protein
MTELLSRKFILTLLGVVLSFVLVLVGKLDADRWFALVAGLVTIYNGLNVLQKVSENE